MKLKGAGGENPQHHRPEKSWEGLDHHVNYVGKSVGMCLLFLRTTI